MHSASELYIPKDDDDLGRPYWNAAIETMPLEEMQQLQLRKLKFQVDYLYRKSALYKSKFDDVGFAPADLRTLSDSAKIPFTTKQECGRGRT